ncbi:MAG: hypothetical protein AAB601_00575 [Patescibacteria group bacterium]
MPFKQVAPGVLVNTECLSVLIHHPDPCSFVRDAKERGSVMSSSEGSLLVFSTEAKAHELMKAGGMAGSEYVVETCSWDALVDKFGSRFQWVVVDKKMEAGFYEAVPLKKEI